MIHEIAVEPGLVSHWGDVKDYRYFMDCFGLGQPRLVSSFPKRWKREALQSIPTDLGVMERKRIEELVALMSETMVRRSGEALDEKRSWLENAEADHVRRPFHLILAGQNPRNHRDVFTDGVIGGAEGERWRVERSVAMPRTPADLADALASMLSNSREIHFVDPHFAPDKPKYLDTLEAFCRAAMRFRGGPPPKTLHVIADSTLEETHFRNLCLNNLSGRIPAGLTVRLSRYEKTSRGPELHNRYILTNIGGVTLGRGLDKGDSPAYSEDIAVMGKNQYRQRWSEYVNPCQFTVVGAPVEVVGTR